MAATNVVVVVVVVAGAVAAAAAAAGEAVVVVMAEAVVEGKAMQREIGRGKTRTRPAERTTTERGDTTRRWRVLLALVEVYCYT